MAETSETSKLKTDASKPRPRSSAILLLATTADTTWRMFVPTVGLMVIGWYGDTQLGTKPWLFALGVIIGATISALLIRNQLRSVKKI